MVQADLLKFQSGKRRHADNTNGLMQQNKRKKKGISDH